MPPSDHAPLLECHGLQKSFGGTQALRGVDLVVRPGEVVGVVGENGAGKSTLMNLIGGVVPLDGGAMRCGGEHYTPQTPANATEHGIAFVHQELNLFPNLSIADNLFLTAFPSRRVGPLAWIDRAAVRKRAAMLLGEVDLTLDPGSLVENLSQAERQLVEIARALGTAAKLVLFDEPTSSLGAQDAARLFALIRKLAGRGLGIVYVSHALEDVLQLCQRITVLRDGAVAAQGSVGEFDQWRLIAAMVGRQIEQLYPPRQVRERGAVVLEAVGLMQPGVAHDISFTLHRGELLGIAGLIGSGRSELARILFGLDGCEAGALRLHGESIFRRSTRERIRRGMAFVTESRREDGLFLRQTVADNMRIVHPARRAAAQKVNQWIEALRIRTGDPERQPVGLLSGGNQQKVVLAKWLLETPTVLIVDEPTRGIDVGAKYEIYTILQNLAAQGVGLLVISSELEELTGICDRILVMRKGELQGEFTAAFDREQLMRAAV